MYNFCSSLPNSCEMHYNGTANDGRISESSMGGIHRERRKNSLQKWFAFSSHVMSLYFFSHRALNLYHLRRQINICLGISATVINTEVTSRKLVTMHGSESRGRERKVRRSSQPTAASVRACGSSGFADQSEVTTVENCHGHKYDIQNFPWSIKIHVHSNNREKNPFDTMLIAPNEIILEVCTSRSKNTVMQKQKENLLS